MKHLLIALITAAVSLVAAPVFAYQVSQPGCGGLRWSQNNIPVDYYVTASSNDQSAGWNMPFSTVQQVMRTAFDSWEEPCCSAFRARDRGTTQSVAWQSGNDTILSVVNDQWDQSWGSVNSTIGITLTVFNPQACTIGKAPIVFNGVRFTFTNNNTGTDLQTIATHEIGHLLGLNHSSVFEATMYASYQGGTIGRSLHEDDINGVCFLYNRPCTCATSNDCLDGDICQNGVCADVPCTNDSQCQDGLECNTANGECRVPPCQNDNDCPGGFFCRTDGSCASRCPVCRDCNQNSDCGSDGVCLTDINKCVTFCQQGNVCPGDSACFSVQGSSVCLNPSAANGAGFCPNDYVCEDTGPNFECTSNVECGTDQQCVNNFCEPLDDACLNVTCRTDAMCVDGECVPLNSNNANNANNNANNVNNANNINNANNANNTANNDANNNGAANNGTPPIVIIRDEPVDDGCSTAPASTPAGAGWLIALIGLFFGVRRRR